MRKPIRRLMFPAFAGAWLFLGYACAVDDENPIVPRRELDLGKGMLGPDGEALGDANGAPICASYGGIATAQQIALAVLQQVKLDCRISATVIQSTTQNHGIQCFQAFVSASFQCNGATVAAGYKDDEGVPCSRPIDDTLSDADFDAFVQDYQAVLKAKGVSDGDIAAVVPALAAQKAFVVGDNVQEGKYTTCAANCRDAGAACVRDAGPPPPKDAGTDAKTDAGPKDAGTDTGAKDAGGGGTDAAPKDSGSDADTGT
jgi:hypothetical protein